MSGEHDGCIFCAIPSERIVAQNEHAIAIRDGFPVTKGHTLVIPNRHVDSYFGLSAQELESCHSLLLQVEREIRDEDPMVTGFNIGVNIGEDAGQTIFHCHIHLIPRRSGDVENPRGGVRHTIPGKGDY